jgi:hypothetical protein
VLLGSEPQFANGIVGSVSFVYEHREELGRLRLAGIGADAWRSPGSSEKLCPVL